MLIIAGNQIYLRDWQIDDLPAYVHWLHPDQAWYRLDGPYYAPPKPESIAVTVEAKRAEIQQGQWPSPRKQLVVADSATNQLLGRVSWYWIDRETHWIAQGIVIFDPNCWGRGIGYEAFGLWGQYLFDVMPLIVRLDLRTWSGNPGMQQLARKLGYQAEARFRKARLVDGVYYDGLGFGILREEWDTHYPCGFAHHLSCLQTETQQNDTSYTNGVIEKSET
jgi:putative hydrolase of HD superfamily